MHARDRFWHKADVQTVLMNLRFEGNNGHDADVTRCLLMTHSGHCYRRKYFSEWSLSRAQTCELDSAVALRERLGIEKAPQHIGRDA